MGELTAAQLRRIYDPAALPIETTADVPPLEDIIGQHRAVSALEFGLGIHQIGFNIYVAGPPGMGKMTAVHTYLQKVARKNGAPPDWVYVNNFDDPYQPHAYRLPTGWGRQLQQDMKSLIDQVRRDLPKAFESEEYGSKRDAVVRVFNGEREAHLQELGQEATKAGLALEMTPVGVVVVPIAGGHPLNEQEFNALPPAAREDFGRRREALQDRMKAVMKSVRERERVTQEQLRELDRQVTLYIVSGLMEDLTEKYRELPEVTGYLAAVQKDILEHIEMFKGETAAPQPQKTEGMPIPSQWLEDQPFWKYQVNMLVDNSRQEGMPVVVEYNPTYNNLFGRVEKELRLGALYADFTMIKPGALHRANGGYLVVRVEDMLRNLFVWDGLKRALRSREIQLEEVAERMGYVSGKSLQPQPVPLDLKVVLIGNPLLYYTLHATDDEFPELFRVKADFDVSMESGDEAVRDFVCFAATFCKKEQLKHLDRGGVAKLLEHAARLAEDQRKLSTHFGALADLIREAHYWAERAGHALIGEADIRKALEEKIYRSRLIEDHVQEAIARGTLLIASAGAVTGQVNGLSVIGVGDYSFGQPSRITASVAPGREGVVDIEREVELGGPIHGKGVLIANGYLAARYGQAVPLSLTARLVFEQSYAAVEGDSASSAELYALLSALADAPLKQGIAVTGSVNQRGEVQAIGGVNQKIEGFFDVCRARGLDGTQGVLIPESNAAHLMLREDVVEAAGKGQFHVWAVRTIDEGMELLTGMRAGTADAEGMYPPDTLNGRVLERLACFAESLKGFAKEEKKAESEKK